MTAAYAVTFGEGRYRPQGRSAPVTPPPVEGLLQLLRSQPAHVERWWSVHTWLHDYRTKENWLSAIGVAVDLDYKVDGLPPAELAGRLAEAARTGRVPGSLFHLTPHGARVVFIYDLACDQRELQIAASKGAASLVERALAALDLFDYQIDPCTWDLGRLYYTPNSVAKGVARSDEVVMMRREQYEVDQLAAEEPPEADPETAAAPPPVRKQPIPIARAFEEAVAQWNADHGQSWPKKPSDCPMCQHKGCFHAMPGDTARWFCFSSNHDYGMAAPGGGHHGDALDLEAHSRGCKTVDVLRADGYLRTPAPRARQAAAAPAGGEQSEVAAIPPPPPVAAPAPPAVAPAAPVFRPWRSRSYLTAVSILRENARDVLEGRRLELNEMSGRSELGRVPLRDVDLLRVRSLVELRFVGALDKESNEIGLQLCKEDLFSAAEQIAAENAYHPVREYLELLAWDGIDRLDSFVEDVLGATRTPLAQAILRRWFISAVARAYQPGCKVDTVLILIGPQGIGKSAVFRVLASPAWFSDSPVDVQDPHAPEKLRQGWIVEWAELESLRRAQDATAVKSFLACSSDDYLAKYARHAQKIPRSCVIVGTTNQNEFLTDETGNRRFWPVEVGAINHALLVEQRDQLWAEAVARYRRGEPWWMTAAEEIELGQVHDEHRVRDAWEEAILAWADRQLVAFMTADVLEHAVGKPRGQWAAMDERRVCKVLRAAGYSKDGERVGATRSKRWHRKGAQ